MNKKAQVATVIAVLLGIFLIVVTAIKFDWVGMVVRGDKIIDFSNDNTDKENNTNVDEKEPNKEEENNASQDKPNNQTPDNNNTIDFNDNGVVNINCTYLDQVSDLQINISYYYNFNNNKLLYGDGNVVATYTLPEYKTDFDKFIANYQTLVKQYQQYSFVEATENLAGTYYSYTEKVDYLQSDPNVMNFNNNTTIKELVNYYENLNYICTKS